MKNVGRWRAIFLLTSELRQACTSRPSRPQPRKTKQTHRHPRTPSFLWHTFLARDQAILETPQRAGAAVLITRSGVNCYSAGSGQPCDRVPNDRNEGASRGTSPINRVKMTTSAEAADNQLTPQTPVLSVACRILRSPSHESVTTDLSLFSVSSVASDAHAGRRLLGFGKCDGQFAARGHSPNPDNRNQNRYVGV